jgi:hypothetical protein
MRGTIILFSDRKGARSESLRFLKITEFSLRDGQVPQWQREKGMIMPQHVLPNGQCACIDGALDFGIGAFEPQLRSHQVERVDHVRMLRSSGFPNAYRAIQ